MLLVCGMVFLILPTRESTRHCSQRLPMWSRRRWRSRRGRPRRQTQPWGFRFLSRASAAFGYLRGGGFVGRVGDRSNRSHL